MMVIEVVKVFIGIGMLVVGKFVVVDVFGVGVCIFSFVVDLDCVLVM